MNLSALGKRLTGESGTRSLMDDLGAVATAGGGITPPPRPPGAETTLSPGEGAMSADLPRGFYAASSRAAVSRARAAPSSSSSAASACA